MPSGNPSPRVIKGNGGRRLKVQDGDEDLADLQRRFTALEDEARIAPPAAQITPRSTLRTQRERSTAAAVRADNETELSRLDEQITTLRRKHDELAHANMEKRRELEKLTDRLQDLSKEAIMPSEEDNATMKEIRALEARLQKAVAKYEDAYEVRRTYEQIVKRTRTPIEGDGRVREGALVCLLTRLSTLVYAHRSQGGAHRLRQPARGA